MKAASHSILILFILLAIQPVRLAVAQENVYQIVDFTDLPPELKVHQDSSCTVEFHEQWRVNAANSSISKKVNGYEVSCANRIGDILTAEESVRLRGISPVIWQQRQTADGEPIHDAATGLPVYYKLKLQRIDLRNP